MNIILIGPQGSGKGTQGKLLAKKYKIPRVSLGKLLRDITKGKSNLGKVISSYIDKGNLVPNEIAFKVIEQELAKPKYKKGVILDGYPRKLSQAKHITNILTIDAVIVIKISEKETLVRLGGRRECSCGEIYHMKFKPPKKDEICDKCGQKLIQRKDDYPAAIKKRLALYNKQTKPAIDYLKKHVRVIQVSGEGSIKDVNKQIVRALKG